MVLLGRREIFVEQCCLIIIMDEQREWVAIARNGCRGCLPDDAVPVANVSVSECVALLAL
jgi:hypothetical protein